MNKHPRTLTLLLFGLLMILTIGSLPQVGLAEEQPIIPCATKANDTPCTFDDFIKLIGNVFNFLVFKLVVPVATLAIAYAGIIYVTNPTNSSKRDQAKGILTGAVWGIVLALGAYVIVTTIVKTLIRPESESGYNFDRFIGDVK